MSLAASARTWTSSAATLERCFDILAAGQLDGRVRQSSSFYFSTTTVSCNDPSSTFLTSYFISGYGQIEGEGRSHKIPCQSKNGFDYFLAFYPLSLAEVEPVPWTSFPLWISLNPSAQRGAGLLRTLQILYLAPIERQF